MSEKSKKKTEQSRRHHYIPEFYLAGFTSSGDKEDFLQVFDLKTGNKWQAKPKNVAHERDLYRWEGVVGHEDFLEVEAFQKIDDLASKVIAKIIREKKVPAKDSEDYFNLIQFIAAFKIRTPRSQKEYEDTTIQILRAVTNVITQSEDRWETVKKRTLGEEGKDLSREQMREVVFNESKFKIEVPRESYLATMSERLQYLIQILGDRNWSLCIAREGNFMCSDYPLVLDWAVPPHKHPNRYPALGDKGSVVAVPLDKKNALLGVFEQERFSSIVGERLVALINFLEGIYAYRFLFSPTDDFIWLKWDRTIGNSDEFIELIKTLRTNHSA